MPMDYSKYHPDWKAISKRIREDRAGNKCEWCSVENKAVGARDKRGEFHTEDEISGMGGQEGDALFPNGYPNMIRIVLTVAHLNHDIADNRDENLACLCQKCHNGHDVQYRQGHAKETRQKRSWSR